MPDQSERALKPCRLIVDRPAPGAWQMAADEVLLASGAAGGGCSLRFYRWSEPTLSLGYFQSQDDRARHPASRDCPLVRRQTGGGAIVHDRELTYSLVLPSTHPLARGSQMLYAVVHEALVRTLRRFGVEARLWPEPSGEVPAQRPFLCFQRREPGDVLVGSSKVCGSAQRRLRGAIMQHGSVLLARSECAPELPGICDIRGKPLAERELADFWRDELAGPLGVAWQPGGLSPQELEQAGALAREKYAASRWNGKR